jgi:uncharacterized protein
MESSGRVNIARGPVRTCIGCRQTAAAAELLRVVVAMASSGADLVLVVPDPDRSAPGRGAWLHPDLECAQLAQRRRAYGRALRVPGPIDAAAIVELLSRRAGTCSSNRE